MVISEVFISGRKEKGAVLFLYSGEHENVLSVVLKTEIEENQPGKIST